MAGKVTSHDVARRAGVSRATVSFVMNRSNAVTIGEETRRRVLAAAEELGYRPNSAARMLKSGATRTIGLIIADAGISRFDGLIPILFWSIGRSARAAGYDLLLESPDPAEKGNPYTALVESRRIDGLLVQGPRSNDTALFELIESDFPTVIIGTAGHPGQYAVNIAGRSSLQEAVSRLIGLGHRRFGYVAFSGPGYVATERRIHAIRETLAGAGLELPDTAIRHGDFSAESGYLAGLALLDAMPDRTAILAGNDTIALGLLSALSERGLSVPEDVSVVGFDDLPFAGFLKPPLSTIRVDADWQGQAAADLLLGRLGHGDPAERRLVRPAPLIWRASAGPPPK
ncbi:LacI family DNA-binding transcriptional regulator [Amaricoccus sp. W119]|uniref:LacI family DNA-binding transcriptional regulator n=1 Tax=Amaricoccus sp. W119 TaxID=3391833 RepID=UPI0039A548EA